MKNWFLEKSIAVRAAIIVLAAAVVTGIGAGVYMIVNHASSDRAEVAEIEDNTAPVVSPVINDQEETEETDAGNDEEVTEVAVIENKETETPEFEYMSYQKTSNRLENGNFADGLNAWEVYSFVNDNIDYTADDYFSITMQETGTEDWHVQLKQTGIRLEKGKWYTISFDAKSTLGRSITCAMQRDGMIHNDDWTPYANAKAYTLTSNWKTYTYTFQMNENTDNASVFMLSLGAINGRRLTTEHTICVDNIKLTQLADNWTDALKVGDNLIGNADFSSESVLWDASVVAPGAAQVSFNGNKATFDITNVGTVDWHVQLKQGAIKLANNQGYRLTFTVSSTTARTIKIGFMDTEYVNWYGGGDVVLNGTENQEVTVDFYNSIGANNNALFMLSMGKIEGVNTPAGKITLSNFKLEKCDSVSASVGGNGGGSWSNPMHNLSNGWGVYDDGSAHLSSLTETNGVTSIAINNTGSQNWHVQLQKKPISLETDKWYTISFDAKSTKDRKIEIAIQHDGNDGSDVWTSYTPTGSASYRQVGAEWQTYTMTFKMNYDSDTAAVCNISLGVVDGESINEQHTVAFRNLKIEEVEAPVKVVAVGDELLADNGAINSSDWSREVNASTATATIDVVNGQFVVDVTNAGTSADNVRIRQDGLKFEQGAKYHVALTVEASNPSEIKVGFMTPSWGWIGGNQFYVGNNGTAAKVYEFDITAEASSDEAMIVIDMGHDGGQYPLDGQPGTYKIYGISVTKTAEAPTQEPETSGNKITPDSDGKGEYVLNPVNYGIPQPMGRNIQITYTIKSTAKFGGQIGGNTTNGEWSQGGAVTSEDGTEKTNTFVLNDYQGYVKIDMWEMHADIEVVDVQMVDVTPGIRTITSADEDLALNPADYGISNPVGKNIEITVSLKSSGAFSGAIGGNVPSGWSQSAVGFDSENGKEITHTFVLKGYVDYVKIDIWSMNADIDVMSIEMREVQSFSPTANGKGEYVLNPVNYGIPQPMGRNIQITYTIKSTAKFGGQIGGNTTNGEWSQGGAVTSEDGTEKTNTFVLNDYQGYVKIDMWEMHADIEVVDVQMVDVTPGIRTITSSDEDLTLNPADYGISDPVGKNLVITVSLKSSGAFSGAIGGNVPSGWSQSPVGFDSENGKEITHTFVLRGYVDFVKIDIWSMSADIDVMSISMVEESVPVQGAALDDGPAVGCAADDEEDVVIEAEEIIADPEDVLSEPEDFIVDGDIADVDDEEDADEADAEEVEAEEVVEEAEEILEFIDLGE